DIAGCVPDSADPDSCRSSGQSLRQHAGSFRLYSESNSDAGAPPASVFVTESQGTSLWLKAYIRSMKRSVLPIVVSAALLGCGYRKAPPDKPPGVPPEAVWAGGADGGSLIFCQVDSINNVNKCTVYNEDTGQIMDRGDFKLMTEHHA